MVTGQLLHYKILEPLGQGGMGEVYLAEDTRLHRKVAIKLLSKLMATDPERRQRFEREAHAIAALNHPNIITIHAVEEADGVPFLVMELVEGKPLSDLIPANGFPLDVLLRIGTAISDAIGAAHMRGITHRDLKPANVMVAPDGRVKVLDFGLAKLRESELDSEQLTRMPTGDLTGEGRIIGTVAYMSPEQAEGKAIDQRSDIFSLGVLLHEMSTGQRPFKGDTNVSVISAILKDTPSSITDLNPRLPAGLAKIIRRALAKDPSRRYQTAVDLRNDLDELKQEIDSGITMTTLAAPAPRSKSGRGKWWAAAAVMVVAGVLGLAWLFLGGRATSEPQRGFEADRFTRLTSSGNAFRAAISADGRYVVHVKIEGGQSSLWVRQTATPSDAQIVAPAEVRYDGVTYAPDGNYVYYNTYALNGGVGTLYKVPILGGTPQRILEDVDSAVSFSPDGRQFAFMRGHPAEGRNFVMTANADGSDVKQIATVEPPDQLALGTAAWSPDGRTILVGGQSLREGPHGAYFALDLASSTFTKLPGRWSSVSDVQWTPGGSSFLVAAADMGAFAPQIWEIDFPSGEPHRITNDLNRYLGAEVSADAKTLVTVQAESSANLWVAPASDPAAGTQVTRGSGRNDGLTGLAWTPDGRLVYGSPASGRPEIWIANADGSEARQLTSDEAPSLQPSVTGDGKYIVFQRFRADGMDLWRIALDGSDAKQLTRTGSAFGPVASRDGKTVYFYSPASGVPLAYSVSIDGGEPKKLADGYFRPLGASPDGATLLGTGWDPKNRRSSLATLPATGGTPTLLNLPVTMAAWAPDGRAMTFGEVREGALVILSAPLGGGAPKPLVRVQDNVFAMAWSPDGRLALSRGTSSSDVVLITRRESKPR